MNIGRRLDLHQANSTTALNSLQGEISKMGEPMASMALSLARAPAPEFVATTSVPASTHQNPHFSTPPLPPYTLPTITELQTPLITPHTMQAPPFSQQFGNLTPEQLPHPPSPHYTQAARQISFSTITTPSITTTIPTTSQTPNYSQFTNPITQLHYYATPTSQNPACNSCPQHQNQTHHSCQMPTYSPHYHPPFPPQPCSYQHSPTPHHHPQHVLPKYPNANQYNSQSEPHLRTPHIELPIFRGDNPRA